jgi:hypothetical protein
MVPPIKSECFAGLASKASFFFPSSLLFYANPHVILSHIIIDGNKSSPSGVKPSLISTHRHRHRQIADMYQSVERSVFSS